MQKKIVLIYPKFPTVMKLSLPIGPLHLGTYLKTKGFEVKLIDCIIEDNYQELITEEIEGALCIGISAMTTQIPHAREICLFIRNDLQSNIPIIFGGVHPTLYPKQTVCESYVNYAVVGEGEITMFNLLQAIENNKREMIGFAPGIAYLNKKGVPQLNFQEEWFNYAEMPPFDYTILNPKVLDTHRKEKAYFPLLTSRGCPYRCAFCINVVTKNTKWRSFSASRTVSEIERIVNMGFNKIWFWDENFFTSKKRVEEILDLLETKNIIFDAWVEGRANYIRPNYLSLKLLKRLKKNGFSRLGIGFESGSQKVLDYLQKDISVEQLLNAARQCAQVGVRISPAFMIGVPTETVKDIKKTVDIMGQISKICTTWGINGPILYRPYPGSKLYFDCPKSGWEEPKNFEDWSRKIKKDFSHPNPYKMPWIKNPAVVNMVHFYTFTLSTSLRNLSLMFREFCQMTKQNKYFFYIGLMGLLLLSVLGKLRYKIGFYRFLIEKKLFFKYHPNLDY